MLVIKTDRGNKVSAFKCVFSSLYFSLKCLDGSKQWSSSAPNLGKVQRTPVIFPGFTSLTEMGKYLLNEFLKCTVFNLMFVSVHQHLPLTKKQTSEPASVILNFKTCTFF